MHRTHRGRLGALSLVVSACLLAPTAFADIELAGVRFPEQITSASHPLVLNGAGIRSKFVIKVYVAALYAPSRTTNAQALINSDEPRRLRLHLLRDIDSKTLDDAMQEGLQDNNSPAELAALNASTKQLSKLMTDVGSMKEGHIIDLDFDAKGVTVTDNGHVRGRIDSVPFARALLRVWLGEHPAQASLKKALLGN